jgi:mono/diheme cytochrome c family protein
VRPALAQGHYTATITLPAAGTWHWQINAFGPHAMPPLTVYGEPGSAAQTSDPTRPAAIGQVLFVAKGCSACHSHAAVAGNGGRIGAPPLANGVLKAEYLRQWLADPKAIKPATFMPNLGLKQNEIEALTAFLTEEPS